MGSEDVYLRVSFQEAFPGGPHLGIPSVPGTVSFNALSSFTELPLILPSLHPNPAGRRGLDLCALGRGSSASLSFPKPAQLLSGQLLSEGGCDCGQGAWLGQIPDEASGYRVPTQMDGRCFLAKAVILDTDSMRARVVFSTPLPLGEGPPPSSNPHGFLI